jgi:hypothetical protein
LTIPLQLHSQTQALDVDHPSLELDGHAVGRSHRSGSNWEVGWRCDVQCGEIGVLVELDLLVFSLEGVVSFGLGRVRRYGLVVEGP